MPLNLCRPCSARGPLTCMLLLQAVATSAGLVAPNSCSQIPTAQHRLGNLNGCGPPISVRGNTHRLAPTCPQARMHDSMVASCVTSACLFAQASCGYATIRWRNPPCALQKIRRRRCASRWAGGDPVCQCRCAATDPMPNTPPAKTPNSSMPRGGFKSSRGSPTSTGGGGGGGAGGIVGVVPAGTRQRRPVPCIQSADNLSPVPCDERRPVFPPGFCLAQCFHAPEQDNEDVAARVQSLQRAISLLSDTSKKLVLIATSMSQTLSQPHLDWQGPNPDQVLTIAFYESSANAEVLTHLVPASPSQGYIEITNTFHEASDLVQFSTHDIINGGVDTSGIRPSTLAVYPLHAKFGQDWMQHLQVHSHTPSHAKIDASRASIHASHARIEASHAKIDASHASPCHGPC